MPEHLLDDLTPAQREAVTHIEGPLLVLAGAGSGKTRVITRRIAYLMTQGVPAWHILAITFTNKAAGEMKDRVEGLVPGNRVWISTFHSLCVRLLRQYGEAVGVARDFTIYDKADRLKVIKEALAAEELDATHWTPALAEAVISRAKNDLLDPDAYAKKNTSWRDEALVRVYRRYEKLMGANHSLDFDDLLLRVACLLRDHPDTRTELDARFRFVLVDEYQDTNLAQYAIAHALSVDYPNLCATGDPDQSIYGWRGANLNNILEFEEDYANCRVVRLEQNYRSTKTILGVASALIKHNRARKSKALWTENDQGRPVEGVCVSDEKAEADEIASRIAALVQEGSRYGDVAVFYRVNALTRVVETSLRREGVPYQIVSGVEFYQRKEIKDVLAYLRLIVNGRDNVSFTRIVNVPTRGIGSKTVERLGQWAERQGLALLDAARSADRCETLGNRPASLLRRFASLIDTLAESDEPTVEATMRLVLEETGYRDLLKQSKAAEDEERLANVEELVSAAADYDAAHPEGSLQEFLQESSLVSEVDGWQDQQNCVSLMTLHSAKGLEFPVVIMMAMEEGLLPHERSQGDDEELEEERRLCFVGFTRAKQRLILTHARDRSFRGRSGRTVPSRFLTEIADAGVHWEDVAAPAESIRFDFGITTPHAEPSHPLSCFDQEFDDTKPVLRVGMLVRHQTFGLGRIKQLDGFGDNAKATVQFNTAGQKRLVLRHAKLEPAEFD